MTARILQGNLINLDTLLLIHFVETAIYLCELRARANVRGLGRGFAVSETFSVLGEPAITGPIAERCRKILGLIARANIQE